MTRAKSELIYIDGLKYLDQFLDYGRNSWDIDLIEARIKNFCRLVANLNIGIKVFIDAEYDTEPV